MSQSSSDDTATDRWAALALWSLGEWGDARYADYLEATNVNDDPMERERVARLRLPLSPDSEDGPS